MPALHLLHRRLELHLPVSLYQHLCFWSEVIPSILAAVRSRVAVMEPSRLERYAELSRVSHGRVPDRVHDGARQHHMYIDQRCHCRRSIESQQAFCVGAKPEIEHAAQPVRAKPEDAPEVPPRTHCYAYYSCLAFIYPISLSAFIHAQMSVFCFAAGSKSS